ncbi:hypothetical protein CTI14_70840, partial [Methylobacterium radiotolerans]
AGLRVGLAVRAHAALREPQSLRPADGHRIPVHDRHRRRRVAGLRVGLAVRAHAALREPQSLRPADGHRIPVH